MSGCDFGDFGRRLRNLGIHFGDLEVHFDDLEVTKMVNFDTQIVSKWMCTAQNLASSVIGIFAFVDYVLEGIEGFDEFGRPRLEPGPP